MSKTNGPYRVNVSNVAREMLLEHVEFLARVSVVAAYKLIDEFEDALDRLSNNPEWFPFLRIESVQPRTYRKCLFARRYELIFLIDGNEVFVDAVRDCRQNPDELLS